jgi:SAM-dependent methyltransferase
MDCRLKKDCICCESENLIELLDLGNQPLANSYHKKDEILPVFPLKLNLCKECFHLQLSHIVNPDLLFKNYLYVSGTSKTLRKYFEWFVSFVQEYTNKKTGSVLDIACNDGTQLDYFKDKGWETFGVEPSENLSKVCSTKHNVVCDYFNSGLFNKNFDIIIAQNVFAHNENTLKFLEDCYEIMSDDSFLFIQTSQSEMVRNSEFDTIYHEHLSFFNINSFFELTKRTKLNLIDVIKTPVHGVSYVFVLSKKDINKNIVDNHILVEKQVGLTTLKTYFDYKENVSKIVSEFIKTINDSRDDGYRIVGYGAAAKGMTFLNFANIKMDYIIDDNDLKHNLYTPGNDTLIVSLNFLKKYTDTDKILFVPLAWNFFDEIKKNILSIRNNPNDVFMKYFPEIKLLKNK